MTLTPLFKALFFISVLIIALVVWWSQDDTLKRYVDEQYGAIVGAAASRTIAKNSAIPDLNHPVKTVAGLHHIEVKADQFLGNIFRASGVANSYLIKTNAGNVLFDTGLVTQGVKHKRLLQATARGDITHIILSHSHADHIGATRFWRAEFPNAKIVAHRRFTDGQRYLTDLEEHFWSRNRRLYSFMPKTPPGDDNPFRYGGIQPDILISDHFVYRFSQGGTKFVVLPTPGAEGDDNIVLWLPEQKALFSGDFFGPLFPMMPNLFTLRGEKFRDPVAYINSLNKILKLKPEIVLPGHFDPYTGASNLNKKITLMRDATAYIHNETIAGMNAGKSVWQLMQDIQLPKHLEISQGHGKVSWNIRSIWEYYSTWFKFNSTTELYPVPVSSLYAELAGAIGGAQVLTRLATAKLNSNQPEKALHLLEIALAATPNHQQALQVRLQVLKKMLHRAQNIGNNFSETSWLESRISATEAQLDEL